MQRKQFEKLVLGVLRELPSEFRQRLENVAIVVKDRPPLELLRRMELPAESTLLGLYEGVPLTERGFFGAPLYPDRIWIFQEPIEEACETEDEIKEEIKLTVVHEVAHFFGFDDEYLDDLGY